MRANKKLGQNFITSEYVIDQILEAAGNIENLNILEIGPGHGALTIGILKKRPKLFVSIEKDKDLALKQKQFVQQYNFYNPIHGDALKINECDLLPTPIKVIANLPYNISTVLLDKWLNNLAHFSDFTLMFQNEVADRIVAKNGSKHYGALSVVVQLLCDVEKVLELGPEAFTPRPKVNSAVVRITPLPKPRFNVDIKILQKILSILFSQRRKMLITSIKQISNDPAKLLQSLSIDCKNRPENLTVEQFCNIASAVGTHSNNNLELDIRSLI